MKTLILTDNSHACDLAHELNGLYGDIDIYQSPNGPLQGIPRLNIRERVSHVLEKYGLVISIHCKQYFPLALVSGIRCINVHPGLNPHNRGWYPQGVLAWSNFADRHDTLVWQSSQVRGKPAWLGVAAAMSAVSWHEAHAALIAWGLPAPWQREQAMPPWPPASGNVAGCEKAELDQLGAVTLWQSSQRREKPAAAWPGLVVAR